MPRAPCWGAAQFPAWRKLNDTRLRLLAAGARGTLTPRPRAGHDDILEVAAVDKPVNQLCKHW